MFPFLPTRTFQIRGPFGLQLTLGTTVPGTLSFTFPRTRTRAQPLAKAASATTAPSDGPLCVYNQIQIDIPMIVPPGLESSSSRRPPSPAPTEVILTQEEMVLDIQQKGIKVRDFAYETTPGLNRVPELFDPDKALGEHDYRLSKEPRTFPIPGKILRRLLDIGWVKLQEAKERWHKMDWDELAAHDSRPIYPWHTLKFPFPTDEQREMICKGRATYLDALERAQRVEQAYQQQLEQANQQQQAEQQQEVQEVASQADVEMGSSELDRPPSPSCSTPRGEKRHLSCDDTKQKKNENTASQSSPDPKRRKLENEASTLYSSPNPSSMPPKQFPAPFTAYNAAIHSMIPNTTPASATTISSRRRSSPTTVASSGPSQRVPASSTALPTVSVESQSRSKGLKRSGTVNNLLAQV